MPILTEATDTLRSEIASLTDSLVKAERDRIDPRALHVIQLQTELDIKRQALIAIEEREAAEDRSRQAQQRFQAASEQLDESKSVLMALRAEFASFPERIRIAEFQFARSLASYNEAKQETQN